MGADKALFQVCWPVLRARLRPPRPDERFTIAGECVDCSILSGPGFETVGLNADRRCEACERWRRRHGPALKRSAEDADATAETA